jgi:hypothetical protein
MRLILSLSALAATLVVATPAFAATQASVGGKAYGVVLEPLTLTNSEDLDFGTVIGSGTSGVVSIDANKATGARSKTGGIVLVNSFPGHRGVFLGAGTAGNAVTLTLSQPLFLTSSNLVDTLNATLTLDSDGTSRTIDATSAFTVGVGGDFSIAANQPNGKYSADFTLTADYQ